MTKFNDLFSCQADKYAKYRPNYPKELFEFLSTAIKNNSCAWDCATGSGQAALGLAPYFKEIIATDASQKQILSATQLDNIRYSVESAYRTSISSNSVNLLTVAQAIHWFDLDKFYIEANRVLTKNGVIAVWCYNLMHISDDVDVLIKKLYFNILKDCWPDERKLVENEYRELNFPFEIIDAPKFFMQTKWTFNELVGYLNTWSAVHKYKETYNMQPIDLIKHDIRNAWGDTSNKKLIAWPLTVIIGYKNGNN